MHPDAVGGYVGCSTGGRTVPCEAYGRSGRSRSCGISVAERVVRKEWDRTPEPVQANLDLPERGVPL
jgi:hypothetical protein